VLFYVYQNQEKIIEPKKYAHNNQGQTTFLLLRGNETYIEITIMTIVFYHGTSD